MKIFRGTIFLLLAAFILLAELGCGDQYRPVANPIIGPGGQPQSTHFAYVLNSNSNPNGDGSTTKIDVSGDTVSWVQTLGVGSTYEALLPNSTALFVANSGDDTVSDYSAFLNGAVTTIGLLPGSHPVFLTSTQTSNMYVLNSGPIKDVCQTGSVSSISTSTGSVTNTVCVGVNPINMVQAAGGGQIFVLNQGDSSVTVLDPTTLAVVKGGTLTSADGLGLNPVYATSSVDGSYIFVVTQGDGVNPGVLDILTPGTPPAVAKKSVPLGVKPTYSYLDPHLNRLYVTNTGDNTVSVFDVNIASPPPIPPLAPPVVVGVGTAPTGIAALQDGSRFYVANSGSNDVSVVSATSFAVLKTTAVGVNPIFVAADPTSTKVYVTNQGSSSTSVIQTVNDTVVATIAAPPQVPGCTTSCALQQPIMVLTQ